jgi:hypothetical protein
MLMSSSLTSSSSMKGSRNFLPSRTHSGTVAGGVSLHTHTGRGRHTAHHHDKGPFTITTKLIRYRHEPAPSTIGHTPQA